MSMVPTKGIDDDLKNDFFNCYKLEHDGKIPYSSQLPKSIVGTRNYSNHIEQIWVKYKQFILEKYSEYQIIWVAQNSAEVEPNSAREGEKFSILFKLVHPKLPEKEVYLFSYYNLFNINIEFYKSLDPIYVRDRWRFEKSIELYKKFNGEDDDDKMKIKQVIDIADKYMLSFYHDATNNSFHYTLEFLRIYSECKKRIEEKSYLY